MAGGLLVRGVRVGEEGFDQLTAVFGELIYGGTDNVLPLESQQFILG
jgi:hypothetical protein